MNRYNTWVSILLTYYNVQFFIQNLIFLYLLISFHGILNFKSKIYTYYLFTFIADNFNEVLLFYNFIATVHITLIYGFVTYLSALYFSTSKQLSFFHSWQTSLDNMCYWYLQYISNSIHFPYHKHNNI